MHTRKSGSLRCLYLKAINLMFDQPLLILGLERGNYPCIHGNDLWY
jgi:hypothetical protein